MLRQCLIATSAIIVYHLFWGTLYSNSGIKSIFFFLMSFWIGFRSLISVYSICSTKRFILISARTYMGSLTCIFRVINYFSVTDLAASLTSQRPPYILGSLLGIILNFSIFGVISVQSKAFRKSIENCVEKILCRFLAKKKVFHTIRISEVWIFDSDSSSTNSNCVPDRASIRAPFAQQTKNHFVRHVRNQW
jgi:hypothetical protein